MRIRVVSALFAAALLCAARADAQFNAQDPAPAEIFGIELGVLFWSPTPDQLFISTGGLANIGISGVDFVNDFGIDRERFTEYRVTVKPARKHKIRFAYMPLEYREEAVLTKTIQFGDLVIPVTAAASADLEWKLWRIGYEWDFVARDRGFVGVLAELRHNKISAELAAAGVGTEVTEVSAPFPAFGGIARGYLHPALSVTAEVSGFRLGSDTSDSLHGKFLDFDLYGTVNLGSVVGIQGGYRSIRADYVDGDDSGELRLKGPYFGGVVRF